MLREVLQWRQSPLNRQFPVRTSQKVRLGPVCIEIRSNLCDLECLRYFPQSARAPAEAEPHYSVNLCSTCTDGPWPAEAMAQIQDGSYRANRFAMGYYITDHYGTPACLVTRGTEHWIFATDFNSILWPYVVKFLLTIYSMDHGMLHLKAASVALDGQGALLVARGGGGKTLLLAQLCRSGAQFLSNTHSLVHDGTILSVPTAVRVRNDALFGPIIAGRQLPRAIKPGEHTADPFADLGWSAALRAPARNICLVDYRPGNRTIREIEPGVLFEYMDQFALALNVYGLKEDLLDYLEGNVQRFAAHIASMRAELHRLILQTRAWYVSCDSTDPANLRQLCELLGSGGRTSIP